MYVSFAFNVEGAMGREVKFKGRDERNQTPSDWKGVIKYICQQWTKT